MPRGKKEQAEQIIPTLREVGLGCGKTAVEQARAALGRARNKTKSCRHGETRTGGLGMWRHVFNVPTPGWSRLVP